MLHTKWVSQMGISLINFSWNILVFFHGFPLLYQKHGTRNRGKKKKEKRNESIFSEYYWQRFFRTKKKKCGDGDCSWLCVIKLKLCLKMGRVFKFLKFARNWWINLLPGMAFFVKILRELIHFNSRIVSFFFPERIFLLQISSFQKIAWKELATNDTF